jgi:hypothetical protein
MLSFVWGATSACCWAIGLVFLRNWNHSRDRFFLFFAAAFWVLSLNWLALAALDPSQESRHWVYLLRVVAFLILIAGILDKNRPPRSSSSDRGRERPHR